MQATKAAFDKYVKVIKKEYAMIGMKRVMSNLAIKLMEATKAAFGKYVKVIRKEYASYDRYEKSYVKNAQNQLKHPQKFKSGG